MQRFNNLAGKREVFGPRGSSFLIDTHQCFHCGSRILDDSFRVAYIATYTNSSSYYTYKIKSELASATRTVVCCCMPERLLDPGESMRSRIDETNDRKASRIFGRVVLFNDTAKFNFSEGNCPRRKPMGCIRRVDCIAKLKTRVENGAKIVGASDLNPLDPERQALSGAHALHQVRRTSARAAYQNPVIKPERVALGQRWKIQVPRHFRTERSWKSLPDRRLGDRPIDAPGNHPDTVVDMFYLKPVPGKQQGQASRRKAVNVGQEVREIDEMFVFDVRQADNERAAGAQEPRDRGECSIEIHDMLNHMPGKNDIVGRRICDGSNAFHLFGSYKRDFKPERVTANLLSFLRGLDTARRPDAHLAQSVERAAIASADLKHPTVAARDWRRQNFEKWLVGRFDFLLDAFDAPIQVPTRPVKLFEPISVRHPRKSRESARTAGASFKHGVAVATADHGDWFESFAASHAALRNDIRFRCQKRLLEELVLVISDANVQELRTVYHPDFKWVAEGWGGVSQFSHKRCTALIAGSCRTVRAIKP